MELDAGVFVEGGVVGEEAVGGLEGAAGLLRVALVQRGVAGRQQVLGMLGPLELAHRPRCADSTAGQLPRSGGDLFLLELERAGPMLEAPLFAERDAPGNVLERQVELGRQQFELQRASPARADAANCRTARPGIALSPRDCGSSGMSRPCGPRHGQTPALVHEGKPKMGVLGQGDVEQALVAGLQIQARLGQHHALI